MADSTPIATASNDIVSCSYQQTVSLYSWWLVKAKNDVPGKRLAIAGVSSKKGEAMRVFVSAPIIKTYDMISLETADGKCIRIHGFINEQRTLENGFMPEVFNSFLFGFPPNWESYAIDCFREESITGNDSGMEKSIPTLISPEEAPRDNKKPFAENECNVSTEMGGVNVACSGGGNRHSARLHDTKVSQKKKQPASGGPLKHPNNENPTLVDLENCDVQGLRNLATPIRSQPWIEFSNDACMENSIPTSLVSPEEAPRGREKPFSGNGCNVFKKMGGVNVACSSGGNRHSARLHDIKVCQQKKQLTSGGPLKHLNNENSTSVDLENCDAQGLRSLATPIQSQLWRQLSSPPEQLVNKSTSRISRTLSPKTNGYYKRKSETVERKAVKPKGKQNKSASAVKNSREKDLSHLIKGNQQQISTVSPQSLSFKKSRSGRLLLPPLEFWRNQIPIYDANHEITEIQEGASLISPCRGSSPSLSRFSNRKLAA